MGWRTLCLLVTMALSSPAVGTGLNQTLTFRQRIADGCKTIRANPAAARSYKASAEAHFAKHASQRLVGFPLALIRTCRMPGSSTTRASFAIVGVSDTEAIYEFRRGRIRDAYLISYWD